MACCRPERTLPFGLICLPRVGAVVVLDEGEELVGGEGLGVESALGEVDAFGAQVGSMGFGFDTLGDDLEAQDPGHFDDDIGEPGRGGAGANGAQNAWSIFRELARKVPTYARLE